MSLPLAAYWELTKPRVVALIVFTAIIGMFLAIEPGEAWPWERLVLGAIGIWLAASSAAAINHLLDQRIDVLMARTQHRPLATGSLRPAQVLGFALVLGALSMAILAWRVNVFTAALTFASLIGYAVIYTGYLKRATPQNIVIGGLAGAAPPALGWAAVKGWPAGVSFWGLAGAPLIGPDRRDADDRRHQRRHQHGRPAADHRHRPGQAGGEQRSPGAGHRRQVAATETGGDQDARIRQRRPLSHRRHPAPARPGSPPPAPPRPRRGR